MLIDVMRMLFEIDSGQGEPGSPETWYILINCTIPFVGGFKHFKSKRGGEMVAICRHGLGNRIAFLIAVLLAVLPAQPVEAAGMPELLSLRGEMYTLLPGEPVEKDKSAKVIKSYIWARDDKMRTETQIGKRTSISIQIGKVIYTYEKGTQTGKIETLAPQSLGSTGIVGQIRRIKKEGFKNEFITDEQTGERLRKYTYKNLPHEMAIVMLATGTSLPRIWYSTIRVSDSEAQLIKMVYRNMQANIEIPDSYFRLPEGMTWQQQK
jgi:outer membrane lipoprotein-sorting protein